MEAFSGPAAPAPLARIGHRSAPTVPCTAAGDGKVGFLVGNTPGAAPPGAAGAAVGLGTWEECGRSRTTPAKMARIRASNGAPMAAHHPGDPNQTGRASSTKRACRTSRGSSTLSCPARTPRTSISCAPNRTAGRRPPGCRAATWTSAEAVPPPGTTIGPVGSMRMRASSSERASSATLSDCSVSLRSVTWSVPRSPATSAGCRSMRTPPTSTITSMSRDVRRVGVSSETTCTTIGYRPTVVGASGGCTTRRTDEAVPVRAQTAHRDEVVLRDTAPVLQREQENEPTTRREVRRLRSHGEADRFRYGHDAPRFPSPNTRSCGARPHERSAPVWGADAPRRRLEAPRP